MKPRFLLDTCIVSEPVKPVPDANLVGQLAANDGRMVIAAITWHELLFGIERLPDGRRRQRLHAYLQDIVSPHFPVLPYDARAAAVHATIRVQTERAGIPLSFADGQIAALALAHELVLVTRNTRDFQGILGLVVENWFGEAPSA